MLIFVNYYTIKILSATRAYVNGESNYSKGQKNALRSLSNYILTEDNLHWGLFKKELSIPQGDADARIALMNNLDIEIVKKGFRAGKNHEDDLNDLIWVFNNFKSLSFFNKAISSWEDADKLIKQLNNIGNEIHKRIQTGTLNQEAKFKYLAEINTISNILSVYQDEFSNILGYGTREIKKYLVYTNVFFILIIISSVCIYYLKMIQKLILSKEEIQDKKKHLYEIIKDLESTKTNLSREIIQQNKIIGTISHDIQSPLKYIVLIGKYLCNETIKNNDMVSYKYANSIHKSSSQLYEFTKILVEYSNIYVEDRDYELKYYFLYDLVNNKKEIFEEIAISNNTTIINSIDPTKCSYINYRIIAIIIHNLLDNAVKNTVNGIIEIGADVDDTKIIFWIKDTGIGMSHDLIAYYTNLFRNEESGKLILRNYGIGLHMVLELLILLKGDIKFSSIINEGTMVKIEIKNQKQVSYLKTCL